MLDTVALPVAFLGALYAGVVPVVANTLLTPADYVYMLTHSHARAVIASGALLQNVTQALESAEHDGCQLIVSQPCEGEPLLAPLFEELIDAAAPATKAAATRLRRHRLLAVFVGLDRQTEGHRPHACEPVLDRRAVCEADPRHHRERRGVLRGQAVLRVRSRQRIDLPAVGRRHGDPDGGAPHRRRDFHAPRQTSPDGVLRRAHALREHAGVAQPARARRCRDAHLHLGGRSVAA